MAHDLLLKSSSCLVLLVVMSGLVMFVNCTEFEVGGKDGWIVPKSSESDQMYNQWASLNRFEVNDTLHFMYKKDSVLVVTEEEYGKCRSSRPLFFSNNGDTVFELRRPGLFYFISGVSGHCDRGQKMIVKVLELKPPTPPPQSESETSPSKSAASQITISTFPLLFVLSFFFGMIFA